MIRKATFACMAIVAISEVVSAAQATKQDSSSKPAQPGAG